MPHSNVSSVAVALPRIRCVLAVIAVVFAATSSACASTDDGVPTTSTSAGDGAFSDDSEESGGDLTSGTQAGGTTSQVPPRESTSTSVAVTSSTDDGVPEDESDSSKRIAIGTDGSVATVRVGEQVFAFAVDCYAPGAGDYLIVGAGTGTESETNQPDESDQSDRSDQLDEAVELYVQAFFAEPYIGLRLADGTLIEAALDAPLELMAQDDVIRVQDIPLVHSLDLTTGESTDAGLGEIEISCFSYSKELPEADK